MYAAILIRGLTGVRGDIKDTLFMLKLRKKHALVLIDENSAPQVGMLQKAKDVITYGPVSDAMAAKLKAKMKDGVAHLAPPRGGFERKGIKKDYTVGGALGKRDSMDKLLEAML
jgi:large subunit ribosomal protein L30